MKQIILEVLAAPGCHICRTFEEFWQSIAKDWPNVSFQKFDITEDKGQEMAQKYMILASPGIVINGELWASGGFDKDKFIAKLKEMSK